MAKELLSALSHIKLSSEGVYVQASTLGSLEALLDFLKSSKIPVSLPFYPLQSHSQFSATGLQSKSTISDYGRKVAPNVATEKKFLCAHHSILHLNEWFRPDSRVCFFMRLHFYINRCVTYCVRSKLTMNSILSLNWLKEEVAYWLKCTYSTVCMAYTSMRTKCSRIQYTLEIKQIHQFCVLSPRVAAVFLSHLYSHSRVSRISRRTHCETKKNTAWMYCCSSWMQSKCYFII